MNKFFKYILGFFLLGVILFAFYTSKIMLLGVSIFFIIIAMVEYRKMFKSKEISPHPVIIELIGAILAYLFIFSNTMTEQKILPVLILGIIMSSMLTIILNKKPYFAVSMSTIAGILFILCGLYIIKLPYLPVYFCAVLLGDYAASIVGPLGKTYKLAPEISPNKTTLGSAVNLLVSCLVCLTLKNHMPAIQCLLTGVVISVFSQIGDLTFSTIKRDLGLKHSGTLFSNYGGIFDRMDAFIFSAPALYYFLICIQTI